jgi:hypothetical protein
MKVTGERVSLVMKDLTSQTSATIAIIDSSVPNFFIIFFRLTHEQLLHARLSAVRTHSKKKPGANLALFYIAFGLDSESFNPGLRLLVHVQWQVVQSAAVFAG